MKAMGLHERVSRGFGGYISYCGEYNSDLHGLNGFIGVYLQCARALRSGFKFRAQAGPRTEVTHQ